MVQSAAKHFSSALPISYSPDSTLAPVSPPSAKSVQPTTYHPFPSPRALSSPSVVPILRQLGFGYRAPFIQRTAELLVSEHAETERGAEGFLLSMRKWETEQAREELLRYVGVGRKVADCVLLMSLDKVSSSG